MAQDLPFFKFIPAKYNAGTITLCSYGAQGYFANICSLYWSRECNMSLDFLVRKLPQNDKDYMRELVESDCVKIDNKDPEHPKGRVRIAFLDEQFHELSDAAKKGADMAAKRWQKPAADAPRNAAGNATSNTKPDAAGNANRNAASNAPRNGKREEQTREDTSRTKRERSISTSNGTKPSGAPTPPLWAGSLHADLMRGYLGRMDSKIAKGIPANDIARAIDFYSPIGWHADYVQTVDKYARDFPDPAQQMLKVWRGKLEGYVTMMENGETDMAVIGQCSTDIEDIVRNIDPSAL